MTAVDIVSFVVRAGEVTDFLGPKRRENSIAMRMMTSLTPPTVDALEAGPLGWSLVSVRVVELLGVVAAMPLDLVAAGVETGATTTVVVARWKVVVDPQPASTGNTVAATVRR